MAHTDEIAERGEVAAGSAILNMGWIWRRQNTSDFGVDAQAEARIDGAGSGRLIALQVKTGPSHVRSTRRGLTMRVKPQHVKYWRRHSLPVFVLWVDLDADDEARFRWVEVNNQSLYRTRKGNWRLRIPPENTTATASTPWRVAADRAFDMVPVPIEDSLERLPASAAHLIEKLASVQPDVAATLAQHLAAGRAQPALLLETLQVSSPTWLRAAGAQGARAVAAYARAHGEHAYSAQFCIESAAVSPTRRAESLSLAAVALADADRARSVELAERARLEPDLSLSVQVALAQVEAHHQQRSLYEFGPDLQVRIDQEADDVTVLAVRAHQADRSRDLDAAVDLWLRVHAMDQARSYVLNVAEALARRGFSAAAVAGDVDRALSIGRQELSDRSRWGGPTAQVREFLAAQLMLSTDFAAVVEIGAPRPHGHAPPEVAGNQVLARAVAKAAAMLGLVDVARAATDRITSGIERKALLIEIDENAALATPDSERLRSEHLAGIGEDDPRALVQAVAAAARRGQDHLQRLDGLVERGIIPAQTQEDIAAIAAAHSDPSNLRGLRARADSSPVVAQYLVELTADRGEPERAARIAAHAAARFSDPDFLVRGARLLHAAGCTEQAQQMAAETLSSPSIGGVNATECRAVLVEIALEAGDWPAAERRCQDALATFQGTEHRRVNLEWSLIAAQLQQQLVTRAADTLTLRHPEVRNPQEVNWWVQASMPMGLTAKIAQEALRLLDAFAGDERASRALIRRLVDRTGPVRPADELDGATASRIAGALQAHIDLHGERAAFISHDLSGPQRASQAEPDDEPNHESMRHLTEQLRPLLERDVDPLTEQTVQGWSEGRVSLMLAARAVGTTYVDAVVRTALGVRMVNPLHPNRTVFVAPDVRATPSRDDARKTPLSGAVDGEPLAPDLELDDAQAGARAVALAVDETVVIEMTALDVATALGEFDVARSQFAQVLTTSRTRAEIVGVDPAVVGPTGDHGLLRWVDESDTFAFDVTTKDTAARWDRRAAAINAAMRSTVWTANVAATGVSEPLLSDAAMTSIAAADQLNVPLWCDDAGTRYLARAMGVAAFSTLDVLDSLAPDEQWWSHAADDQIADEVARRRALALGQLTNMVVDVEFDTDLLATVASQVGWLAPEVLGPLCRTTWWTFNDDALARFVEILDRIRQDAPAQAGQFRDRVRGAVTSVPGQDARQRAVLDVVVTVVDPGGSVAPSRAVEAAARLAANEAIDPSARGGILVDAAHMLSEDAVVRDEQVASATLAAALAQLDAR